MMNPMLKNELCCYGALIEHLKKVPGIYEVIEIDDLSDIDSDNRKHYRVENTVYVIFDGFRPIGEVGKGTHQAEEISFTFILLHQKPKPSHSLYVKDGIGETLTALKRAFRGFEPQDENGIYLTTKPFMQRQSLPIRYRDSWGYFPVSFVSEVAT